jgi:hypothetical protein
VDIIDQVLQMAEPTQIPRNTSVSTSLHARITVMTMGGFMDALRQVRLSAVATRESMSSQASKPIVFTEPTQGTL